MDNLRIAVLDEIDTFKEANLKKLRHSINDIIIEQEKNIKICTECLKVKDLEIAFDIIENSNVIIFDWAVENNSPSNYVSKNISQFGYEQSDFYTGEMKDYWNFIHKEDLKRVKNDYYGSKSSNTLESQQVYRIKTKTNEIRWVEERLIFERNDNFEIIKEKGLLIDVTELKILEHELKKSETRLNKIFENAPAIIATTNSKGLISAVNRMFTKITGYKEEELLNVSILSLIKNESFFKSELGRYIVKDLIDPSKDENIDLEIICKDGSNKYINITANVIDESNGEIQIIGLDITEKKADEKRIKYLSYHDKLTGLHNRAHFDDVLEKSTSYPFSIIIADMNGLKEVNDNFGHKEGDHYLVEMASIFRSVCSESDVICRIGGDEFSIVCTGEDITYAKKICEDIKNKCKEISKQRDEDISISLGYSSVNSKEDVIEKVLKEADDNMYKDKSTLGKSTRSLLIKAILKELAETTPETKEHAKRVKDLAVRIGKEMNLDRQVLDEILIAAPLHDLGKITIPEEILNKKGKLTEEEYLLIKNHSFAGYNILKTSGATKKIAKYVLHHHERMDGNGYPNGLKAEEIPLVSRIIAVADAYDVMTINRRHTDLISKDQAIKELIDNSGTQFDKSIVDIFIKTL